MRSIFSFLLLYAVKTVSRIFYRVEFRWVVPPPEKPWQGHRVLTFLNHTSLFEPIFAGGAPSSVLWNIASRGVLPVAQKTIDRPFVGLFFRLVARDVVSITREPDHTWQAVLGKIGPDSMVVIAPEGRMMRADGLDSNGNPMTVRGGIADVLQAIPEGRMLLAYSNGLHHVQVPGQRLPRLFKRIRMNLEVVDIAEYREQLIAARKTGFKVRVKQDLTDRRDRYSKPGLDGIPI